VDTREHVRLAGDVAVDERDVLLLERTLEGFGGPVGAGSAPSEYVRGEEAVAGRERRCSDVRRARGVRPDHPLGDVHLIFSVNVNLEQKP
jgi:hypothetical protein